MLELWVYSMTICFPQVVCYKRESRGGVSSIIQGMGHHKTDL